MRPKASAARLTLLLWRFSARAMASFSTWSRREAAGGVVAGAVFGEGKIRFAEHRALAQDHRPLHRMAQRAHIAGPGIGRQPVDQGGAEALGRKIVFLGIDAGVMLQQQRNVVAAARARAAA